MRRGRPSPRDYSPHVAYGWAGWRPALWTLSHAPHLLVSGRTGTGKSSTIRALVAGLPKLPTSWRVIIIDPKRVDFGGLGNAAKVVHEPLAIAEAIDRVHDEAQKAGATLGARGCSNWLDYQTTDHVMPVFPTLLVVDEAVAVFGGGLGLPKQTLDTMRAQFATIVMTGRAVGVSCVVSMLRPDVTGLGSTLGGLLREQMTARLVLGPVSDEHRRMLDVEEWPASRAGHGHAVAIGTTRATEGKPTRVTIPYVSTSEAVARLDGVSHPALLPWP